MEVLEMYFKKFDLKETWALELVGNKKDFDFYSYQYTKECILFGLKRLRTEKFTQEVSVLRNHGILIETMTSQQAYNLAKKSNKNKKDIPRYKVKAPLL
jgi:hypothetical protein